MTFVRPEMILFDHCILGTLNLCMSTFLRELVYFPSTLCFMQLHCLAWHSYQLCVRSVVFHWLRHERSVKRFSHTLLGVWVLVCGGIGHMANEFTHFSCCHLPLPDLPPTHPSYFFHFLIFSLKLVHCLVCSFGLVAFACAV